MFAFYRAKLCDMLRRVRLSVCLSQAGIVSKRLDESSWVFGTEASSHPSYTVL